MVTAIVIMDTRLNSFIEFKVINERMYNITVLSLYSPTKDAEEACKKQFYGSLEQAVGEVPMQDITIELRYFNAKINGEVTA